MRRIKPLPVLLVGLVGLFGRVAAAPSAAPGVTVDAQGQLVRDGRTVRAIGVNYFDAFLRALHNKDDTSYDAGFAVLQDLKIPFARFAGCGFWPAEMRLYLTDKPEYLRRMDGVVRSAEKHGIGLVPSLFWNWSTIPDLAGETCDQWGNPDSKTHALMRAYVADLVDRYKDSPAIWGWEFGNEFNLEADLPDRPDFRPKLAPKLGTPQTRGPNDRLSTDALRVALAAFAREVRRHDPSRFITSGNSLPRAQSWHRWKVATWDRDTGEQTAQVLSQQHPAPIDVVSLHYYGKAPELLKSVADEAARLHEPLFIGEFGADAPASPEGDPAFEEILRQVETLAPPLAAVWVYDFPSQEKAGWNISATNSHASRLRLVAEANRRAAAALGN